MRISHNKKSDQYWPKNEGLVEVFGPFHVENINEARVFDSSNQIIPDTIKRKLGVRHPFQGIFYIFVLLNIFKSINLKSLSLTLKLFVN